MIHVQPARQYQLRRACDRCHKSKLRCLRSNDDDEACQRCLHAAVECVSSPAAKPQRQRSTAARLKSQGQTTSSMASTSLTQDSTSNSSNNNTTSQHGQELIWHNTSIAHLNVLPDFPDQVLDELFLLNDADMDITLGDAPDSIVTLPVSPTHTRVASTASVSTSSLAYPKAANTVTDPSSFLASSSAPASIHPQTSPYGGADLAEVHGHDTAIVTTSSSPSPSTRQHSEDGPAPPSIHHYMRKISDVGLNLMQHLQVIPIIGPEDDSPEQLLASCPSTKSKCPIDQVFHLSEIFVETLDDILARLPPAFPGAPIPPDTTPNQLSLDAASELLIFSTYLRLVETYDRILQHIQLHCQQRRKRSSPMAPASSFSTSPDQGTSRSTHDSDPSSRASFSPTSATAASTKNTVTNYQVNLPGWSIGTFSLSVQSKTQQLFMIHLIETMLVRAGELVMSDVVSKRATMGYRGNWQCFGGLSLSIVPDLALQAVRTRDKVVMKRVADIKSALRS